MAPLPRILPILFLAAAAFGQTADLEILSVTPNLSTVTTDQTFIVAVRARNHGPDAASHVSVAAGANALTLLRGIQGPAGWTCDTPTVRFGYAATCTAPTLAANTEVELLLTLSAPQHTAMTFRVTALTGTTTIDPVELNNGRQTGVPLMTSETHSELALAAETNAPGRATFTLLNNGPHEARNLLVVFGQGQPDGPTLSASGSGWKCAAPSTSVACTRTALAFGATTTLDALALAPAGATVAIDARVRAEQIYDANGRNNAASVNVVATPVKSKRRAARP